MISHYLIILRTQHTAPILFNCRSLKCAKTTIAQRMPKNSGNTRIFTPVYPHHLSPYRRHPVKFYHTHTHIGISYMYKGNSFAITFNIVLVSNELQLHSYRIGSTNPSTTFKQFEIAVWRRQKSIRFTNHNTYIHMYVCTFKRCRLCIKAL